MCVALADAMHMSLQRTHSDRDASVLAGDVQAALSLLPTLQAEHAAQLPHFVQQLLWHAPEAALEAFVDTPALASIDSSCIADAAAAFVATGSLQRSADHSTSGPSIQHALQRYLEKAAAQPGASVCVHDLLVALLATSGDEEALLRCVHCCGRLLLHSVLCCLGLS